MSPRIRVVPMWLVRLAFPMVARADIQNTRDVAATDRARTIHCFGRLR